MINSPQFREYDMLIKWYVWMLMLYIQLCALFLQMLEHKRIFLNYKLLENYGQILHIKTKIKIWSLLYILRREVWVFPQMFLYIDNPSISQSLVL